MPFLWKEMCIRDRSEDDSPAAINACIRQLLHEFNQASYLGITATPFANIFINPETEDEMIGDDLFPRDFIYSLAPPTNYIGADKIFGDATEKFSDVLIPLRREEMDLFFPFTHKKTCLLYTSPAADRRDAGRPAGRGQNDQRRKARGLI